MLNMIQSEHDNFHPEKSMTNTSWYPRRTNPCRRNRVAAFASWRSVLSKYPTADRRPPTMSSNPNLKADRRL